MLSDGLRSLSAIVTVRIYKPSVARFVREKGGRVKASSVHLKGDNVLHVRTFSRRSRNIGLSKKQKQHVVSI